MYYVVPSGNRKLCSVQGGRKNWSHFVLRRVTLKVLNRSAPNLAQINAVLTLNSNFFESTLENKVGHLENDNSHNKWQIKKNCFVKYEKDQ